MGVTPFSVSTESRNRVARIALGGEIDLATAPTLHERLSAFDSDGVDAIILDLRDVTFIDSTGLHAFLRANTNAEQNGHRFAMVGANKDVRRLFELTRTTFLLDGNDALGLLQQFAETSSLDGQARPAGVDSGV